jgi:hypothetical protein
MRNLSVLFLSLCGFISVLETACSHPTTLGSNTGVAYDMARENQMLNPEAGENLEPVAGMEGNVSKTAMDLYRKGFEKMDESLGKSAISTGVQTK